MKDLESVILTADLPAHGLKAGDIGVVVLTHSGSAAYEVEFAALDGETVAVVTLPSSELRPIGPQEIAHARHLAATG